MKKIIVALIIAASAVPAQAGGEKSAFEPAASYIDDQTLLIVRIDVTGIKLDGLFDWLGRFQSDPSETKLLARSWLDALNQAGVKEAFIGLSLSDPLGQPFGVLPLANDGVAAKLQPALMLLPKPVSHVRDKNAVLVGVPATLERLRTNRGGPSAEMKQAIMSLKKAPVQGVVVVPPLLRRSLTELVPNLGAELGGESIAVIDRGFRWGTFAIELPPAASLQVTIQSESAEAAAKLAAVIKRGLARAAEDREIKNFFAGANASLSALAPEVSGNQLVSRLTTADLNKLLLPAVDKARTAALRTHSANNLRQLGIAMHNYVDLHKTFPPPANYDANGKPLLSWRVHILPLIDHDALYKQFRLNEPWDSDHNKKLIEQMPKVYRSPLLKDADRFTTTYLVPTGKNTVFANRKGVRINDITDGTSQTILIVEANDRNAVVWTKPEDLDIAAKDLRALLVRPELTGFIAAFADGSVQVLAGSISQDDLLGLLQRNDGRVVNRQ